jgi:hypothetical protein
MQYVHHGTLAVPVTIETQYERAKAYLCKDPLEAHLFRSVENAPDGRHFRIRANHRDNDYFDPNTNTIGWDPYSALRTASGGAQSPALGLGHEVDHADEDPAIAQRLLRHADARYDNREERRVILGSETQAARFLGEATRRNHDGVTYRVASPDAVA